MLFIWKYPKGEAVAFQNVNQLLARFKALGANRIFCKRLSENDNSKQQIYLGSKFEVLSFFPHGDITAYPALRSPNFKAPIDFFWISDTTIEQAPGTQLILYPQYPEVRLSGFLAGCATAPSQNLQQRPKNQRRGADGRVLIFGTTANNRTLACLAPESSSLSEELLVAFLATPRDGIFLELTLPIDSAQNRALVLEALRNIYLQNPHLSCRRDKHGTVIPYNAPNGGGYTLEALLGITPNGNAEPDYLGWEIKAFSKNRVTLMTPEPTGGWYRENGVKAFVEKYGRLRDGGVKYFTGLHKVGVPCTSSGMTMQLSGFDANSGKVTDVNGTIYLSDANGANAASWGFAELLTHWNRKHAFAAYVPYTTLRDPISYKYRSPILMGEHTDFPKYLQALNSGSVVFDPGSKVTNAGTAASTVKARSQFRVNINGLCNLYDTLTTEPL